jgi:hypothetical protein
MSITPTPRWSLGRGNAVVPSRWQATRPLVGSTASGVVLGQTEVADKSDEITAFAPRACGADRRAGPVIGRVGVTKSGPRSSRFLPSTAITRAIDAARSGCESGRRAANPAIIADGTDQDPQRYIQGVVQRK